MYVENVIVARLSRDDVSDLIPHEAEVDVAALRDELVRRRLLPGASSPSTQARHAARRPATGSIRQPSPTRAAAQAGPAMAAPRQASRVSCMDAPHAGPCQGTGTRNGTPVRKLSPESKQAGRSHSAGDARHLREGTARPATGHSTGPSGPALCWRCGTRQHLRYARRRLSSRPPKPAAASATTRTASAMGGSRN
jgi:hypothetical protein